VRKSIVRAILGVLVATSALALEATTALALPAGRHYEMVTPSFKAGYGVLVSVPLDVAPTGDSVAFTSLGAFAGAPADRLFNTYLARRDAASGWMTNPLSVPANLTPYAPGFGATDFSSTLEEALFETQPGGNNEGAGQFDATESEFLLHPTDAPSTAPNAPDPGPNFVPAGQRLPVPFIAYRGGSADLSHLLIAPEEGKPVALTPEAQGATGLLYDMVTTDGSEGPLKFVGLDNKGQPIQPECDVQLGAAGNRQAGKQSTFNAIADDGREIFFWSSGANGSTCLEHQQLFVRLDDARTLEISRPLEAGAYGGCVGEAEPPVPGEVPCQGSAARASAEFAGASADGSKVFFTATLAAGTQPLVSGDGDVSNNLYMATIGCDVSEPGCEVAKREVTRLAEVSHDEHPGEASHVQGVVAVSPEGSHVYYVARGVLSGPNAEGKPPVDGADNLYAYDTESGSTAFVAELCSGSSRSGGREDVGCPENLDSVHGQETKVSDEPLWAGTASEAQTADNGRYLVFSSYGQLTSDDADNARDVFLYDTVSGDLQRVSVGEAGYGANGNQDDEAGMENGDAEIAKTPIAEASHPSKQAELASRDISQQGTRVVFKSAQALAPAATNGLVNAYEWHEGAVSLVSTGSDEQEIHDALITPSGDDIFFTTVQRLLSQDTDEAVDLYDARTGPGFPSVPATRQPCSGDACHGLLTSPAPVLVPASVVQSPGEQVVSRPKQKARGRHAIKCKRQSKKGKRRRCSKGTEKSHKTHKRNRKSTRRGRV
jgi:hypothetical protein